MVTNAPTTFIANAPLRAAPRVGRGGDAAEARHGG